MGKHRGRHRAIHAKGNDIKDITTQINSFNEDEVRRTRADFESVIRHISILEQGLAESRGALHQNSVYRDNIQRKLDRLAGSSFETERKRRDLAAELERLFGDGISVLPRTAAPPRRSRCDGALPQADLRARIFRPQDQRQLWSDHRPQRR
jgi:hypothetical protein